MSIDSTPDGGTTADWRFVARQVQQLVPDPQNPGQNLSYLADYPSIGMDNARLFITLNMFRVAPQPEAYDHVQIMIWQKAPLLLPEGMPPDPLAVPIVIVRNTTAASGALSLVPASVVGPISPGNVPAAPGDIAYFVEVPYLSNTEVRLWVIRDPSGVATAPSFFPITVPTNGGQVFNAPQPLQCCYPLGVQVTLHLDTVSDEGAMDRAYWHRGTLWVSTTRGGTDATGTVFYYAINTNNFPFASPALRESGSISKGTADLWNYVPALGVNERGEVGIAFTESSSTIAPRIVGVARGGRGITAFEPVPTSPIVTGTAYSASFDTTNPQYLLRWGDYGAVAPDPSDHTFRLTHEYARSTADNDWGTTLAKISPSLSYVAQDDSGTNEDNRIIASAVDATGYVYAIGHTTKAATARDIVVMKYGLDGFLSPSWADTGEGVGVRRYAGPGTTADTAIAIVAAGGFIYAGGNTVDSGGSNDLVVLKIDAATGQYSPTWPAIGGGDPVGIRTRPEAGSPKFDDMKALTVDVSGNVYVTGQILVNGAATGYDELTLRFNAAGTLGWQAIYAPFGGTFADDGGNAITLDTAQGFVYVTGYSVPSTSQDYVTIKYNAVTGAQVWAARYDFSGSVGLANGDFATGIAVDPVGNVYVTGKSYSSAEAANDCATIKYNANGVQQWVKRFDVAGSTTVEEGNSVALGAGNTPDVFVGGRASGKLLLLRYTNAGVASSAWATNGSGAGVRIYSTLSVNTELTQPFALYAPTSDIYATGRLSDGHWQTIYQNGSGATGWTETLLATAIRADFPAIVLRDTFGGAIVGGFAGPSGGTNADALFVRYNSH